jgi:uncharacterized protein YcfL
MKKLIFILSLVFIAACSANEEPQPDPLQTAVRCDSAHMAQAGIECMDGTRTGSNDTSACAAHGGVKYRICN